MEKTRTMKHKPEKNVTTIKEELKTRRTSIAPINERIKHLRDASVNSKVKVSPERARLVTKFYKTGKAEGKSYAVKRAQAFKYLMENVSLPVEEGQLIVGSRGAGPKEVPTYPEICCHTMDDLETLDSREKNPYKVDEETERLYREECIPFWKGKTMRERIFNHMSDEWKDAYNAGVFTEFMEQRVPGHTAGGGKIYRRGLLDIKEEIEKRMEQIESSDREAYEKLEELKAMKIAANAMIIYAQRYAEKLEKLAEEEQEPQRKEELEKMAAICRRVPAHPPRTFWEALQHYWFIHVGVTTEANPWDAFNPGRIDQHLYPFYKKDKKEGRLGREKAKELLEAFWLKFNNQPAVPKVGVTAQESNTYNDFSKPNIGGVKADGSNAVNELSYIILEVLGEMRTVQPNLGVLISKRNPNRFLTRALDVVKPGFGKPPFYNQDEVIKILLRQGKSLEDARMGGCSGCVESGAWGKEAYILSGYLNLPKIFELTLHNGMDPRTGKKIGIETGDPSKFESFEELFDAFKKQLQYFLDIKMKGNDIIEALYAHYFPVPFLSLWIEDCVQKAKDYNAGGAKYNTQYIQIVGLGTLTDSLASLKYNVFDKERFSLTEIVTALEENFEGSEEMRQIFLNKTPKFGNDNDYPDDIAQRILNTCVELVEDYPPTPIRGASRRVYGFPTTVHVYFGEMCGATPDGREAGKPLSEGISPVQGADKNGIGAVFRSIGKLDHIKTGGTLLNQKLSPDIMQDEVATGKLAELMRAYFKMGAHHVQYNVVSADLLQEAQERPEDFQDLMVRVAGYSDYFVNLPEGLQNEIIERTEQQVT